MLKKIFGGIVLAASLCMGHAAHADPYSASFTANQFVMSNNAAYLQPGGYIERWGNGFDTISVTFPFSGNYRFTLKASINADGGVPDLSEIRLDQMPVAVGSMYAQLIGTSAMHDYQWNAYVLAGVHKVAVSRMNSTGDGKGNLKFASLTIDSPGQTLPPAEPAGSRDAYYQPGSSYSPWNTAIGSGIVGGAASDPDVTQLRGATAATINAGDWSMPFYLPASATDPNVGLVTVTDNTYPSGNVQTRVPTGMVPATPPNGDRHMIVYSTNRSVMNSFFGCTRKTGAPPSGYTDPGFECNQSQVDSVCGMGLGGYGWGWGVIRAAELSAGSIKHALRYSLPLNFTKAADYWMHGNAYPATRSDYNGPSQGGNPALYTGSILYGSFFYIPGDVDPSTIGITTVGGLALFHALQDYGAYQRDTGGSGGPILYAETSTEGTARLAEMRAAWGTIITKVTIGRNLGPLTPNGGGTPRQAPLPGIARGTCPEVTN